LFKKPVGVAVAINIKGIGCGGWWEARLGESDGESVRARVEIAVTVVIHC
jgi:hypothetical protein